MKDQPHYRARRLTALVSLLLGAAAVLVLVAVTATGSWAQTGGKEKNGTAPAAAPGTTQIFDGTPIHGEVNDYGQIDLQYTNLALGLDHAYQFYDRWANGVFVWANAGATPTVFGPADVPAGNNYTPYTPVSNVLTGAGTAANPWVVTTVLALPGTNLLLTQRISYVNGAEFLSFQYALAQTAGTQPVAATIFHAGDLYTAGHDSGYGFYDSTTGGVGSYFTLTLGTGDRRFYQQFVPQTPANAYEESYYDVIWDAIGNTTNPGPGFNDTVVTTYHDAGAGLQWNVSVPASGNVSVSDTDLFSTHASLCGSFSDVHYGDFAYEHIYYLACHGIVGGYSDTTFRPNNNVTRGQLSKIVANSAGFNEPPVGQMFTDVPPSNPFYPYVQRMATRGLISGYTCGGVNEPCDPQNRPYFRPNSPASRGQIAKIVSNAAGFNETPTGQSFTDVPPSNPFYLYVERLYLHGVMSGYTCGGPGEPCDPQNRPYFRWGNNATRAQTAKIDANTFFAGCCTAGQK